ncbi:MAG: ATP-dependent transcriptional regulator, MalT-like, LuxR family [Oscillospiraceae bacterium]|jgi:LuxR family maltose regulon positive regulatory protein|nr:ATP-dependent transcriptional regulator, MalT-like, LuxR family [Oscillospiraceae bacterium]
MQSKPYHKKIFLSDSIKRELAQISNFPLTVVQAPSGFGKTTAVREYLKESLSGGAKKYWYTCLNESPSVAWAGICDLFSDINNETAKNLKKLGFPTVDTLMYISACFKNFSCSEETYIVIDNYQFLKSDILQELMSIFSMHGSPHLHMIFITQHLGKKAQITFHNTYIHTIESYAFFFDKDSTANLFKMEGIYLNEHELNSVYTSTEGWISALRLQISNYRQTGSFDYTADIDHLVETAIWNRLLPDQKTSLVSLSIMESFTARQAAIMMGVETLPEHFRDLLKYNDFIRYFPREKIYVMHSILQNYLRIQFYQYQPEAFQKRVLHTAGQCCIAESEFYTAARFFFEVRDFDAIFSIPFNGTYLINKRESNITELLVEVINECPEETMCKYPFVLLVFSYLFRMDGEYESYDKLCRLVDFVLKSNPEGISKDELRLLKGEFLLLKSFTAYNDIKKVNEGQKAAYELLGGSSRFGLKEIPMTLGGTSILSTFWREPGKLDETLADMIKSLPYHLKLTRGQGAGADSTLHAEMMFMRGDDIQAEILCHKALYQARSKQETYICLCAEQVLARIAILRGDVDGFFIALENIKGYAKESSNLYVLRMVDICLSVISVALDTTDMVAKWFCDTESMSKKVYARAVPYVNILYSHLLVRQKKYAELLGLVDNAISMAKEMNYIFPQVYSSIFKARVCYTRGCEREALENLEEAFILAFPDKIYMPFTQFIYMGDILSKAHICPVTNRDTFSVSPNLAESKNTAPSTEVLKTIPGWKAAIDDIMALYNRYHKGRAIILNALNQEKSSLTPREREVSILAKARLSHQEIAEKLYISKATVRTILYNAYRKLGIHSKSELYNIDF